MIRRLHRAERAGVIDNGALEPAVFVRAFPEPGTTFQVSKDGGSQPVWRRDGKELFFRSSGAKIMAASVETAGQFQSGAVTPLFAVATYGTLMEALGDLERGFQLKLQGLECDSTSALAHVQIAGSFWNQRRYDDVIVWANKVLDRNPQHLIAREELAGAYWKLGNLERAQKLLSDRTQPDLGNEECFLAVRFAQAGDLDAAF